MNKAVLETQFTALSAEHRRLHAQRLTLLNEAEQTQIEMLKIQGRLELLQELYQQASESQTVDDTK